MRRQDFFYLCWVGLFSCCFFLFAYVLEGMSEIYKINMINNVIIMNLKLIKLI
jgi:ATP/ADP translocase